MLEPDPNWPRVAPEEVALALIPGAAFDRRGFRLRYGGGYFDRLLPRLGGITVGITYVRFALHALPHGPDDRSVQHVLTEAGWGRIDCQGGSKPHPTSKERFMRVLFLNEDADATRADLP